MGLMGEKPEDCVKVEQIVCEAHDLRNACIKQFYTGDLAVWTELLENAVKSSYTKFEAWLTQQGTVYTAGSNPTAGDFHLWEMVDQLELLARTNELPSPLT